MKGNNKGMGAKKKKKESRISDPDIRQSKMQFKKHKI